MSWNESGEKDKQNDPNDPWKRKPNNNPIDLDQVLAKFLNSLSQRFNKIGNNSGGPSLPAGIPFGVVAVLGVFVAIWVLSGFYIVNPAEKAVILRFGKYEDVSQPGLHWMAQLIDSKYQVDVQKIYSFSIDGDFLTKSSDQGDLPSQSLDVTPADMTAGLNDQSKNLVNVELNVQYRVSDPRAYLFNVVSPNETVQQVAAGSLSAAIGQMKLDDVLTTGREFLSSKVFEASKKVLTNYNAGVEIVAVTLRKVQAPDQVRAAFNDVNRADQDKATYIQQAQAYASKVIPIAQGMAARTLADAQGYQQKIVLTAQANIARYQALLNVYLASPDVTRERMYLETMQTVLSRTSKILVDSNAGNNLLYLPVDKLLKSSGAITKLSSAELPAQPHQMTQYAASQETSGEVRNETN